MILPGNIPTTMSGAPLLWVDAGEFHQVYLGISCSNKSASKWELRVSERMVIAHSKNIHVEPFRNFCILNQHPYMLNASITYLWRNSQRRCLVCTHGHRVPPPMIPRCQKRGRTTGYCEAYTAVWPWACYSTIQMCESGGLGRGHLKFWDRETSQFSPKKSLESPALRGSRLITNYTLTNNGHGCDCNPSWSIQPRILEQQNIHMSRSDSSLFYVMYNVFA